MRILNVGHNYFVHGGSDRVLLETEKLLADNGHTVIPFCASNKLNNKSEYSHYFPKAPDPNRSNIFDFPSYFYNFNAKDKIKTLLKHESFDIAHLHIYYGKITTSILNQLKQNKIPIIQTLHEYKLACPVYTMVNKGKECKKCIEGSFYNCVTNRCKNNSFFLSSIMAAEAYFSRVSGDIDKIDLFLSVSEFHKKIMLEAGVPENKVKVLHNFVNSDDYYFDNNPKHDDYFLYFGRIEEIKGIDSLINAFSELPYKLLVVGGGAYLDSMLDKIAQYDNISYLGFMNGDELKDVVRKATGVIVPSIWNENCPMNVLEAKSLGRPVIGSSIGGIPELIRHNIDGYCFTPGNVDEIKHFVEKVVEEHECLSLAARQDVIDRFSHNAYYNKLTKIYEDLIRKIEK